MQLQGAVWVPERGTAQAVALEVLRHGPLARSDIARRLGLSPGSLTRLAAPLIESGLLVEVGERAQPGAGRPSRLLDVQAGSRHFVGMKLTATEVSGVVTDLRATVVAEAGIPLDSADPDRVVARIGELVQRFVAMGYEPTMLGIGVGGLVAPGGVVLSAPFLDWEQVPLGPLVERAAGVRTIVDNDLVAVTECENWFGTASGVDRFAVVTLGAGVGYGLVVHGQIVVNEDSGVGLVGHWPLDPLGPLCPAGHRGCAHSLLTDTGIVAEVSSALGRSVTFDEALDAAEAGDPAARRVVTDAGRGLGRLLAAVANLTVPQLIVIGGEGARLAVVAKAAVTEGFRADRDPRAHDVPLTMMPGGGLDWCRGAAVLAIQEFAQGA